MKQKVYWRQEYTSRDSLTETNPTQCPTPNLQLLSYFFHPYLIRRPKSEKSQRSVWYFSYYLFYIFISSKMGTEYF